MHVFPAGVGLMVMLALGAVVDTAPTTLTKPAYGEPPDPSASQSDVQARSKSAADTLIKQANLSPMTTNPSRGDGTTPAASSLGKRTKTAPVPSSPSRRAQILKMLSALEELHRVMNGSLSTRITVMARGEIRQSSHTHYAHTKHISNFLFLITFVCHVSANGKISVKKNKRVTAEDSVKTTTGPPMEAGGNALKASTDHIDPSSWAFKKSLPPQPKKPNKRVCFWKYCSQN
ncbi:urotensin II-related peptide [Osmerus eperlanus]|uniref:urotensin II-related peptide n=1 Tax=Osmerus eperlanus TaxID=29151 RepID=UPI002E1226F5